MPVVRANHHGPIEIYYEEQGAGVPVVLIGGLTSTVATWALQTPALARHHRVVAPDNRGSGRTRVVDDDGVRTPGRFASDVVALLDALEIDSVHLVGASLGGMIVQEVALAHPQRLLSLTIACSTHGGPHAVAAAPEVLAALLRGSGADASDQDRDAAFAVVFHPDSFARRPQSFELYAAAKAAQPHSAAEVERRRQGLLHFDSRTRLPGLQVPTLVITGAQDRLIPPANSRALQALIPGAELVLIEDAGHVFFVEQPAATNAALLTFFAKHAPD